MKKIYERMRRFMDLKEYMNEETNLEFIRFISQPRRILFAPWGIDADTSVVAYFNRDWVKQLPDDGPEIFIFAGNTAVHPFSGDEKNTLKNRITILI